MIARVEADPDFLPRTENFGVDYMAFSDMVNQDCPSEFLKLALSCVTVSILEYTKK
jgi:protein kinase 2